MSTSENDQILTLLEQHNGDVGALIRHLLPRGGAHRDLLVYILVEGLTRIQHRSRQHQRAVIRVTELARDIRPPSARPRYEVDPITQRKIQDRTLTVFAKWMVGKIPLGDMRRDALLAAATSERRAGDGHYVNARFYEGLAAPMSDDETVRDRWRLEGMRLLHQAVLDEILATSHRASSAAQERPSPVA